MQTWPSAVAVCTPVLFVLACSLETVTPPELPDSFDAVVFPGEAELSGSAFIALSSNYITQADDWERYDLHPDSDTVEIHVVDESDTPVEATVRGVFNLGAAPTSVLADTQLEDEAPRPGAFVTVALFNLPSAASFDYTPGTTFATDVLVTVRGNPITDFKGRIRIKGSAGAPTLLNAPGFSAALEPLLAPQPRVLRLRPVRETSAVPDGFPAKAAIGGLQADIDFDAPCLEAPRAYAATEASGSNVYLGPVTEDVATDVDRVRVVMTRFGGFTLLEPIGADPDRAGEGPILDLAFDEPVGASGCAPLSSASISVRGLFVTDPSGATLIDLRDAPDDDSTHLFEISAVERD